jgi:hypothetical protein
MLMAVSPMKIQSLMTRLMLTTPLTAAFLTPP